MELVSIVARWTHIGTAIIVVGGTFFLRFVLAPAASKLPETEHLALKERVMNTWKKVVHGGIALFIISGFYNYLVVQAPLHKGDKRYHMLMGIKILLAFATFFLASVLVGRSKSFDGLRKKSASWQVLLLVMAAAIVGISGYLKIAVPKLPV